VAPRGVDFAIGVFSIGSGVAWCMLLQERAPKSQAKLRGETAMNGILTFAEASLINAYGSTSIATDRQAIIRRYADMTRLSMGRAEDALDLWVHILSANVARGYAS
jgi:hypothetical protein